MSTLKVRRASQIRVRRPHWTWTSRIPRGELTLVAGREGIGKSTLVYWLVAAITTGSLAGEHKGRPRSVVIAATEDSWEHTIVPRLIAAGADLQRVLQIEAAVVVDEDGQQWDEPLSLPRDVDALADLIESEDVAMVVLDPLLSRLSGTLDSHKDAQVRQALEPLVRVAHQARCAVVGIIHVNKAATSDVLNTVMGSRAFTATARAVLYVMTDPEDESTRLVGLAKCNIGPTSIPTLTFTIESHLAGRDDDDGTEVWSGALQWTGETDRSVTEALRAHREHDDSEDSSTAQGTAEAWLEDYLKVAGEPVPSADIKAAARKADISPASLQRAASKLVQFTNAGFPRRSHWQLQQPDTSHATTATTATTVEDATTEALQTRRSKPVVSVVAVVAQDESPTATTAHRYGPPPAEPTCSTCGEPLSGDGLIERCKRRHAGWVEPEPGPDSDDGYLDLDGAES